VSLEDITADHRLLGSVVRANQSDEFILSSIIASLESMEWRGWNIPQFRKFITAYILCYSVRSVQNREFLELLFSKAIDCERLSDERLSYFVQHGKALCVNFMEEILLFESPRQEPLGEKSQLKQNSKDKGKLGDKFEISEMNNVKMMRIGDVLWLAPMLNETKHDLIAVVSSIVDNQVVVNVKNEFQREVIRERFFP